AAGSAATLASPAGRTLPGEPPPAAAVASLTVPAAPPLEALSPAAKPLPAFYPEALAPPPPPPPAARAASKGGGGPPPAPGPGGGAAGGGGRGGARGGLRAGMARGRHDDHRQDVAGARDERARAEVRPGLARSARGPVVDPDRPGVRRGAGGRDHRAAGPRSGA